jgi:hypothetical protein
MENKSVVNNHNKNDDETTSMFIKISRILIWISWLYTLYMGAIYAIKLIGTYSLPTYPVIGIGRMVIIVVFWLIIGGYILSFKKQRLSIMISLLVVQVILEVLSPSSYGFSFSLGTLILAIATLLLWLYGR